MITSYPGKRPMLIAAGLSPLSRAQTISRSLTLHEAAAKGLDARPMVASLRDDCGRRLARARRKSRQG